MFYCTPLGYINITCFTDAMVVEGDGRPAWMKTLHQTATNWLQMLPQELPVSYSLALNPDATKTFFLDFHVFYIHDMVSKVRKKTNDGDVEEY